MPILAQVPDIVSAGWCDNI